MLLQGLVRTLLTKLPQLKLVLRVEKVIRTASVAGTSTILLVIISVVTLPSENPLTVSKFGVPQVLDIPMSVTMKSAIVSGSLHPVGGDGARSIQPLNSHER